MDMKGFDAWCFVPVYAESSSSILPKLCGSLIPSPNWPIGLTGHASFWKSSLALLRELAGRPLKAFLSSFPHLLYGLIFCFPLWFRLLLLGWKIGLLLLCRESMNLKELYIKIYINLTNCFKQTHDSLLPVKTHWHGGIMCTQVWRETIRLQHVWFIYHWLALWSQNVTDLSCDGFIITHNKTDLLYIV